MLRLLLQSASKNQGFTLIELLVVVVITGILAAIAIPSFLSRANTAKQVEAKMYLGSMNRTQEAFYVEYGKFATTIQELGLYSQPTAYYDYEIDVPKSGSLRVNHYAKSKVQALRPYSGAVALVQQGTVMQTVLCEAVQPAPGKAADPIDNGTSVTCADGTKPLN